MTRPTLTLTAGAFTGLVLGLVSLGFLMPGNARSESAQARAVAVEFFHALNTKHFAQACDLLSSGFYRQNHVPDKRHCVVGLTITMSAKTYRFRIMGTRIEGDRAVVQALADGTPGRLVLERDGHGFKILAVRGA